MNNRQAISQAHDALKKAVEGVLSASVNAQTVATREIGMAEGRITRELAYKSKGFSDACAQLLVSYGMSQEDAYAASDGLWDLIKNQLGK